MIAGSSTKQPPVEGMLNERTWSFKFFLSVFVSPRTFCDSRKCSETPVMSFDFFARSSRRLASSLNCICNVISGITPFLTTRVQLYSCYEIAVDKGVLKWKDGDVNHLIACLICVGQQRRILKTGNSDLLRTGKRTSKERNKEVRRLREGVAEKDGKKSMGNGICYTGG